MTKADNGDVDLYLGDGLVTDLGTALNDNCQDSNPECESSVQEVLLSGSYGLQSRAIGLALLVGGIVLAILAAKVIETWKVIQLSNSVDKAVPLHFNAGKQTRLAKLSSWNKCADSCSSAASEISSATANPTATAIVVETASGDSGMQVSVPNIPTSVATSTINTATLTTGVVVSIATDSANGHNLGDYVIDFKDPGL